MNVIVRSRAALVPPDRLVCRWKPARLVWSTIVTVLLLSAAAITAASASATDADSYEPDDSYGAATPFIVGGTVQQHTLQPEGNEDWVSFAVTSGSTYKIETGEGTPPEWVDTKLYLYDSDGTTQIDYDDQGGTGDYSLIEYTADADKTVYARVTGAYFSATGAYTLSVGLIGVADSYEPDDSYGAATPSTVGGNTQQHTIHPADDEDWVSFAVSSGWSYTIETDEGTPSAITDTALRLYDSDGTTEIDYDDNGGTASYSRIEYTADASKTLYARVEGSSRGSYALSVTAVPLGIIGVPGSLDFGTVAVGASRRHTITVQNTGAAPLTITGVQVEGSGFSVVRNEAGSSPIPAGQSREIELQFSPTVGYGGPPHALERSWTSVPYEAIYDTDTGLLYSRTVFAGFQNTGGAGNLGWQVRSPALTLTGTGAVLAGARYRIDVVVRDGPRTGLVELLQPVSKSWNFEETLWVPLSVTYVRVKDGSLTIQSNDPDNPTKVVGLYAVSVPAAVQPPTITGFTPTSGPVGTAVTVTGKNLSGATRVTFNGLPAATFTALSATQIRATVPKGRTGGRIVVSTPGGSCTSAGSFTLTRSSCKVTMTLSGLRRGVLKFRRKFTAKGRVTSANLSATKAKLTLQRKRGKKWVKVKIVSRTLTSTDAYSWKYKPARKGTYRIRATVAMTATNKAGATKWRTFKVR
jgi:hypothetical protein